MKPSKPKERDWRPKIKVINDVIAEDVWRFREGKKWRRSLIRVGRPAQVPDDEYETWFCPLSADGVFKGIRCVYGVGPVDTLRNAMTFLNVTFSEFEDITPRYMAEK